MSAFSCGNTEQHVSQEELENILNTGEFAIICAWPRYLGSGKKLSSLDVAQLHKIMERYFSCRELKFIRADGFYDNELIKDSYIVLNANEEIKILARNFAQYSLLVADKGKARLIYFNGPNKGKYNTANNWTKIYSNNQDHTAVKISNSEIPFKFTWNFDYRK